jgi:hypothetical protein
VDFQNSKQAHENYNTAFSTGLTTTLQFVITALFFPVLEFFRMGSSSPRPFAYVLHIVK